MSSPSIQAYSNLHPCSLQATKTFCQINQIELNIIQVGEFKKSKDTRYNIELDFQGRHRDLANIFKKPSFFKRIVSFFQSYLLSFSRNKILLTNGNKIESLLHYAGQNNDHNFLKPFNKSYSLYSLFKQINKNYFCLNIHLKEPVFSVDEYIYRIYVTYNEKYQADPLLGDFLFILNKMIFPFISNALVLFQQYSSFLKKVNPSNILLTADSHENNLLIALAAKANGIKTTLTPHGLYGYGYPQFKSGKDILFNKFIAFGKKDIDDYKKAKVDLNNIKIAAYPHFAKFHPFKNAKMNKKIKALVLPLEYSNIALASSIRDQINYFSDTMRTLSRLQIDCYGFKFRGYHASIYIEKDLKRIDNLIILDPEKPLHEYFSQVDIIIGPTGSAMIEATLSGLKYYAYLPCNQTLQSKYTYQTILDYYHTAHSQDDLYQNIVNDNRLKNHYTINDIIQLGEKYDFNQCASDFIFSIQKLT